MRDVDVGANGATAAGRNAANAIASVVRTVTVGSSNGATADAVRRRSGVSDRRQNASAKKQNASAKKQNASAKKQNASVERRRNGGRT